MPISQVAAYTLIPYTFSGTAMPPSVAIRWMRKEAEVPEVTVTPCVNGHDVYSKVHI